VQLSEATVEKRYNKHINNLRNTSMKIKLLPSWGCADIIVLSIFSVYITFVFFTIDFWDWKWKTDKGENYYTIMPPTFSVTFDWDRIYEI
jgi:hypothetical protein